MQASSVHGVMFGLNNTMLCGRNGSALRSPVFSTQPSQCPKDLISPWPNHSLVQENNNSALAALSLQSLSKWQNNWLSLTSRTCLSASWVGVSITLCSEHQRSHPTSWARPLIDVPRPIVVWICGSQYIIFCFEVGLELWPQNLT